MHVCEICPECYQGIYEEGFNDAVKRYEGRLYMVIVCAILAFGIILWVLTK